MLSTASSGHVLNIFSMIIIFDLPQAASWILHPLSVLRSIATYISKPMFVHYPPRRYHLDIDLSAQIHSPGMNIAARLLLKFVTKSFTNFHRNIYEDIHSGRVSCWSLNMMCRHLLSNLFFYGPVLPKAGAGRYLDDTVLYQIEAQEKN